jgi:hypothetical protein
MIRVAPRHWALYDASNGLDLSETAYLTQLDKLQNRELALD